MFAVVVGCGSGAASSDGGGGAGGGRGGATAGTGGGGSGGRGGAGGSGGRGGAAGGGASGGRGGAAGGTAGTGTGAGGASGGARGGTTGGTAGATGGTAGASGGTSGTAGSAGGAAGAGGRGTGGNVSGGGGSSATGGLGGGVSGAGGVSGGGGASGVAGSSDAGTSGGGGAGGTTVDGGVAGGGGSASCTIPPTDGGMDAGGPLPDNVVFLPNVAVATLAGGPSAGSADGPRGVGTLSNPVSVAIEPNGAVVVTDFDTNHLRCVATDGALTTLTAQASFQRPYALGYVAGALYAQTDNGPTGAHNLNSGTLWSVDTTTGLASAVAANVGRPRAFAALSDGRVVLSDFLNYRVRVLDVAAGTVADLAGLAGCSGLVNGTGTDARFVFPSGIVVLPGDRIIVADRDAHLLREVTLAGKVTTFAGDGVAGTIDGPRAGARFSGPRALAVDASGAVFVSDDVAHRIRRVAANGTVTTVAGNGIAGFADASGDMSEFFGQEGIAVRPDGATLYVADGSGGSDTVVPYNRLRMITIGP